MNLSKSFANAMRYVSEAALRIFRRSDDDIPTLAFSLLKGRHPKALNGTNDQPIWLF
jgi:hypothetical protein